jgi:hypothetical protein
MVANLTPGSRKLAYLGIDCVMLAVLSSQFYRRFSYSQSLFLHKSECLRGLQKLDFCPMPR